MATFTFSKPWDLTISARDLKSSFITRALRVRRYSDFIITLIIILFLNLQWLKNWKLVQVSSSKSIFYLLFFWRIFSILELFSIDGAIRVISDDFSISLLNPESELYKYKADKYENMVSTTFYSLEYLINVQQLSNELIKENSLSYGLQKRIIWYWPLPPIVPINHFPKNNKIGRFLGSKHGYLML